MSERNHSHQPSARSQNVFLPGSTIGLLGGGQLGRMIALSGRHMGYRFVVLDPTEDSPCGQCADRQIIAPYDDRSAAEELARQCDVITYEFENVDADVAQMLAAHSVVPQGSRLLYTTQHRIREKQAIEAAGVPVAPYRPIDSLDGLRDALQSFGTPAVLKTATGGYDGKGQWVLKSPDEAAEAYETLSAHGTDLVLEQFIRFDKEISVIAARSPRGEIKTFPPAENIHVDNILHLSIAPARISDSLKQKAEQLAHKIAESLDVVGLVAVEMFVAAGDTIYVNELAPRPHNSGHYTIEACRTSQFEQHVRAVCNLPLGSTELLTPAVMVNVLGEHVQPLLDEMAASADRPEPEGVSPKVHLYGKKDVKPKRKMGHVNVLAHDTESALQWIRSTGIWSDGNCD